jgi:hypothetical protein
MQLIGLIYLILIVAGLGGYISNIVEVAQADYTVWSGLEILRVIGIFIPFLGAILGFV